MPLPFNRNIKILYEIAFNIDITIFAEQCCTHKYTFDIMTTNMIENA